jgi:predicted nucleotidyltransferase/predicted transcriptional regulator
MILTIALHMKLTALLHMLVSGARAVGDLSRLLHISNTYASQITDSLVNDGFALKERAGKKVIVRPNMASPFVQNFSKFIVIVGTYPPHIPTDFLEPESKRKVIWQLKDRSTTIGELRQATGYSRMVIYDALRPFLKVGLVTVSGGKRKNYSINKTSPLTEPLFQLLEFFESEIDLRPLLEKVSSDERVIALSVFGSQTIGRKDKLSDVDAFVVVNSPEDTDMTKEYAHSRLQLNIYSRKGIVQLARREPWFLKLALDGRILKGRDFIATLERVPLAADFRETVSEIKKMLDNLGKLLNKDKARIMMYCIRTTVAMKLFAEKRLSQENFIDELYRLYPEFDNYRKYDGSGKIEARMISTRALSKTKQKILEELKDVEKEKEKGR